MSLRRQKAYLYILNLCIISFIQLKCGVECAGSITDVTSSVGLSNIDGVMVGFCDFDSDRDTDIIVIRRTGIATYKTFQDMFNNNFLILPAFDLLLGALDNA